MTEAERGRGWSPSQPRPLPWGAAPQERLLLLLVTTCLRALGLSLWVLSGLCIFFSLSPPRFSVTLVSSVFSLWQEKTDPLGVYLYAHKPLLGVPRSLSLLHTQTSPLSITPSQRPSQRYADSSHSHRDAHYLARSLSSAVVLNTMHTTKGLDTPSPPLSLVTSHSRARHRQRQLAPLHRQVPYLRVLKVYAVTHKCSFGFS